jgi:K+-dependent Na+/Ca+ exchanger-like protein
MIILYLIGILIILYLLALITDQRFVPALEHIAHRTSMTPSVAGATLMAMGSSAPELSISLLALFTGGGEHHDMGIATIVGSAIFNLLVIIGVSALPMTSKIRPSVFLRDAILYAISIALLLYFFHDGTITLLEGSLFVCTYAAMLIYLFWSSRRSTESIAKPAELEETKNTLRFFLQLIGDPARHTLRVFLVSIALISLLCYFLIQLAVALSTALDISPVIVGLTILAAGTSVPDMLASYNVAKKGFGEMAVANAIGSNTFDILIGLGLPWVLAILISSHDSIEVSTADLQNSAYLLSGSLLLVLVILLLTRKLNKLIGSLFLFLYLSYVVLVWLKIL